MTQEEIKFITEIIKPWETLNVGLSQPLALTISINDFIVKANSLAISIKHFMEVSRGINSNVLVSESSSYKIMHDLADSSKHGKLRNSQRESSLILGSMYERRNDAKVRFLRNKISIIHATNGKIDFMESSLDCILFLIQKMNLNLVINSKLIEQQGEFTGEIKLHISKKDQIAFQDLQIEIVQKNENGSYENVDLNGTVIFTLTSD